MSNPGINFRSDLRPSWANFSPSLENFSASVANKRYVALCGANNGGKSTVLKGLSTAFGSLTAPFLGTNRFLADVNLGSDRNMVRHSQVGEMSHLQSDSNNDGIHQNIEFLIFTLSNTRRNQAITACSQILGVPFSIEKEDPDNDFSLSIVRVGGIDLKKTSTGTRLIFRTILHCFDERIQRVLIDEPELGFAPETQVRLFRFLHDFQVRAEQIPHITSVYVATHSHLFLDKNDVSNNYAIHRLGQNIYINNTNSIQELNQLQFRLLGNELDSYLLPAAIIVVEGKTDVAFIKRVVAQQFPRKHVVVIASEGDVVQRVRAFNQIIGGIQTTPYYDRTFVVMDSIHHGISINRITDNGIIRENVIKWDRNGIEFVYPCAFLAQEFRCSEDVVQSIDISDSDNVICNGITIRKSELADRVCSFIGPETVFPEEFNLKFLGRLTAVLGEDSPHWVPPLAMPADRSPD